jgi:hypothetical protein
MVRVAQTTSARLWFGVGLLLILGGESISQDKPFHRWISWSAPWTEYRLPAAKQREALRQLTRESRLPMGFPYKESIGLLGGDLMVAHDKPFHRSISGWLFDPSLAPP